MPSGEKMWLPLESNPEVMMTYMNMLGAKQGTFEVSDVYGLDDDLLSMVPPLAVAMLMLFPITDTLENAVVARDKAERDEAGVPSDAKGVAASPWPIPKDLFFMEQLVGNACGTIGLLHAVANNLMGSKKDGTPRIEVAEGSYIDSFLKATVGKGMNPLEIGQYLERSDELDSLHLNAAVSGQSELPDESKDPDAPCNRIYHFIAFVVKDGYLWELDGRRPYPRRCGPCEGDGMPLMKAAANVIQWYMQQDPENIQFGLTALVANDASAEGDL